MDGSNSPEGDVEKIMEDEERGRGSSLKPMKVETALESPPGGDDTDFSNLLNRFNITDGLRLPQKFKLVTDENALKYSLWTLRFAVSCASINSKLLNPNYPIMVSPGLHPESFPSTEPFSFNSATYFIPMCSLLGVAISSVFIGQISDRVGRKRVVLFLSVISGIGSIVKYYCRHTFWAFSISSFITGLFLGNLPVAMAYCSDVFTSKKEKEVQLGIIVGCYVTGTSGGGIVAILMDGSGLFAPLWVGAGCMFISSIVTACWMIEPGDNVESLQPMGKALLSEKEEKQVRPDEIDSRTLWNIVGGALADNVGSTGLFPLCMSPLALNQYFVQFYNKGEDPIMSITGYKWLTVMVAGMVVPSTMMTPYVFKKIGVAATCVCGNIFTAIVTFALLMIGTGVRLNATWCLLTLESTTELFYLILIDL